jgi:hypothetical protein
VTAREVIADALSAIEVPAIDGHGGS